MTIKLTDRFLTSRKAPVAGRVPGIQAVYNRHCYSHEKSTALRLWAEYVLALSEKREATVVAFRPAAVA